MLRRTTNFYVVSFRNVGRAGDADHRPSPLRRQHAAKSGSIPAEIWRANSQRVDKLFVTDKEIVRLELDPRRETADTEESNNHWPPKLVPSRFKLFKDKKAQEPNAKSRRGAEQAEGGQEGHGRGIRDR